MQFYSGTHDIINATARDIENNEIIFVTHYFELASASGALYVLIYFTDEGEVDFTRSTILTLARNTSYYSLPSTTSPGRYKMFVYDIKNDGKISDGINYPAITGVFQGKFNHLCNT